jgi:hypothetical protein
MSGKGNPEGVGRPKGAINKVGADVRALAREYTPEAVEKLVEIMRNGDTSQSQGMAADKLLDRGWGKPNQPVEVNAGQSVIDYLAGLSRRDIPEPVVPEPAIVRH